MSTITPLDILRRLAGEADRPIAAVYAVTSKEDAAWERLRRWEAENERVKRLAPQLYQERRRAFMEQLGLPTR